MFARQNIRASLVLLVLLVALVAATLAEAAGIGRNPTGTDVGEAIFRHGILGSGAPLELNREPGLRAVGADAACINCHQRSGLGSKEGNRIIPPITGRYLFHQRSRDPDELDLPYVEGIRVNREAYSDASLARVIREGMDSEGRSLDYLMPRYALGDDDMTALIAYLKRLDQRKVPGVTATVLHFATIVTPEADPQKVAGMLDVLRQFVADKNAFPVGATPRLRTERKMMFMANRHWELHVWRLTGPAKEWQAQLERHLADEPVLAVVSGIGGKTWAPVQAFCEQATIPCLFPNVEAPPADADHGFYSMYFSGGVLLEAELIADRILAENRNETKRVVWQIYRSGDSGEPAAHALAAALGRQGITVRSQILAPGASGRGVADVLRTAAHASALVLWLRPSDLAHLGNVHDAPENVFMSGLMGGLESAPLPSVWRSRTRLAYPFDLPERRRVRVDFARGWFAIRHIPVVDEQVQVDTYLACGLLAETLSHMSDTFVRDYLVERIQTMLEHRVITGYYPQLALATGQRFASKGGYLVRFAADTGKAIVPESDWIRPALGALPSRPAAKPRMPGSEVRSKDHGEGIRMNHTVASNLP